MPGAFLVGLQPIDFIEENDIRGRPQNRGQFLKGSVLLHMRALLIFNFIFQNQNKNFPKLIFQNEIQNSKPADCFPNVPERTR